MNNFTNKHSTILRNRVKLKQRYERRLYSARATQENFITM